MAAQTANKHFDIPRTATAPEIDGVIGADEWAGAARIDDLHQVVPVEFSAPTQRTVWFLKFDERHLYIGCAGV